VFKRQNTGVASQTEPHHGHNWPHCVLERQVTTTTSWNKNDRKKYDFSFLLHRKIKKNPCFIRQKC